MDRDSRTLSWVTPARYVGYGLLVTLLVATALAVYFMMNNRLDEAIITLLFAICFLLTGLADLLGELIMLSASKLQRPDA